MTQPYHTSTKSTAYSARNGLTGNVDHVEAPLDYAGPSEVLSGRDKRAGGGIASGGADLDEVAREEDGRDEREGVYPEWERHGGQRASAEEQAEEEREHDGDEHAPSEVFDRLRILLGWMHEHGQHKLIRVQVRRDGRK